MVHSKRTLDVFSLLTWVIAAQAGAQSSIAGRVMSADTKAPVMGAELIVLGQDRKATSDSAGRFSIRDIKSGNVFLVTRAVGFKPDTARLELFEDESISRDISLAASATTLGEVVVRDSARLPVPAKLRAFDERRRAAVGGQFIDSTVIAKWENRKAGDLFSIIRGVDVQRQRGEAYLTGSRAAPSIRAGVSARPVTCFMDVYLDGAPVALANTMYDINTLGLNHVAAIEVYSSTANVPAQYNRTSRGCGVVLIWTK
jgi:hypothetical protein